jgi:hypothetical protein
MTEQPPKPVNQQLGERSAGDQSGNAASIVRGLVQQQRLNLGTISDYCTMWNDIAANSVRVTPQPEAVRRTLGNITRGLDYLAFTQRYNEISEGHRAFIREDMPILLRNEGTDQVVLPYEDAKLLQMAAAAVNIDYDPGQPENTPENLKKRTFNFTNLEERVLQGEMSEPTNVVEAYR